MTMLDGALTRSDDGGHTVTFTRKFSQPAALVWAALTDPKILALWLGEVEIEARLGGRYIIHFRGMSVVMTGRITQFVPERLLEYSWLENYGMPASLARWEIERDSTRAENCGCSLRLSHSFPPECQRADILSFLGGWHAFLNAMPEAIAGAFVPYAKAEEKQLDAGYRAQLADPADDVDPTKRTVIPMEEYGKRIDAQTLQFVRLLPGPIEKVWAYLADSDKRGEWFASGALPARIGESFELRFKHSTLSPHQAPPPDKFKEMDATGHTARNILLVFEPPHRLAFTFGPDRHEPSEVEFRLTQEGDKVRLTLTHSKIPDRAFAVGVSGGWHAHLEILQDKAEGRIPPAFWDVWRQFDQVYETRYEN